ncbi:peptidase M48-like protein [Halanaerobium saccharolyticum]|uniref:Peptidase M48-like protein n=1 Tax=Halanaerobium saccharolyticum TaxID=43595 RepID=A0A4R7YKL1_9FIRM|nr:M48 family metallopeptidase [Halanaerobium saccharolyticum]RAK08510.1 peptidase M48-like protein [Halanaerobium saccharolyticum]TDV97922.1 peptidase M48-like protein [Halanaerobium saccharolyticum]TDX60002.1 peptidase M48-like protein [Halanaerobium saccharolyticum]
MKRINLSSNKFLIVVLTVFLVTTAAFTASAFSEYEEDVAARLYDNLEQEYRITEFKAGSLEFETLERLEANIVKGDFKDEEFKLHHIHDQLINAYYIGDGNIMLFEGLLQKLNTEDQLAGLVAHEMGHAVEEHLTEDLERNMGLSILNLLFNHFTDNQYQTMTNVAQNLIANGYSREQEQESDIYAVDLMMRSGYDPQGLIELMKIFKENSNNFKLLEFTQTHPIPESRIEYLEDYIAQKRSNSGSGESNSGSEKQDQSQKQSVRVNRQKFENELIAFSYPEGWEFSQARALKEEIKFRYQLEAEEVNGEIFMQDLSGKTFMETSRKQFNYAAITAEENGFEVRKRNLSSDQLDIYQLQLQREDELSLEYFINQKNEQQLLKLSFEIDGSSKIKQRKLIEQLVNSLKFK